MSRKRRRKTKVGRQMNSVERKSESERISLEFSLRDPLHFNCDKGMFGRIGIDVLEEGKFGCWRRGL